MHTDLSTIMKKLKDLILFDIDDTLFDTKTFRESHLKTYSLHHGVEHSLQELQKIVELGIYSQGEIDFQHTKLRKTNISTLFDQEHIYIVADKVAAIKDTLQKYTKTRHVYFIEDRLSVLMEVKKAVPSVFTVWIKQGRYAPTQEPIAGFTPDAEIDQLSELIPIITKQ